MLTYGKDMSFSFLLRVVDQVTVLYGVCGLIFSPKKRGKMRDFFWVLRVQAN
jgi:hypothetical protein